MHVRASDDSSGEATGTKRKPVTDTRIHWSNEDEGWIGGKSKPETETQKNNEPFRERFSDLVNKATSSHYQLSVFFFGFNYREIF